MPGIARAERFALDMGMRDRVIPDGRVGIERNHAEAVICRGGQLVQIQADLKRAEIHVVEFDGFGRYCKGVLFAVKGLTLELGLERSQVAIDVPERRTASRVIRRTHTRLSIPEFNAQTVQTVLQVASQSMGRQQPAQPLGAIQLAVEQHALLPGHGWQVAGFPVLRFLGTLNEAVDCGCQTQQSLLGREHESVSWGVVRGRRHASAMPGLNERLRTSLLQALNRLRYLVGRNAKRQGLFGIGASGHHAHDFAAAIEDRPAGVSRIDGSAQLEEPLTVNGRFAADDATADGIVQDEETADRGAADDNNIFAAMKGGAVGQAQRFASGVRLQDRQIPLVIDVPQLQIGSRRPLRLRWEIDPEVLGELDFQYMGVRDDPILGDIEPAAAADKALHANHGMFRLGNNLLRRQGFLAERADRRQISQLWERRFAIATGAVRQERARVALEIAAAEGHHDEEQRQRRVTGKLPTAPGSDLASWQRWRLWARRRRRRTRPAP